MDLRMIKTRKQIKEAFITLREKLTPDKIKVKDICEVAMINKTTFYNHYTDSTQLEDEIDDLAVDKVMLAFKEKDKMLEDPQAYIFGFLYALEKESTYLKIVFRDKSDTLCSKLEARLQKQYDGFAKDEEDRIRFSFIIGGFVKVVKDHLMQEKKCDIDKLAASMWRMLDALIKKNSVKIEA